MRINPFPLLSFKSTPIYDVKVKGKVDSETYDMQDATFSRLNPSDLGDLRAIGKLQRTWGATKYGKTIIEHFMPGIKHKKNSKYYAIELKGNEPLHKRILSLCELTRPDSTPTVCKVDYLQSSPDITNKKEPEHKGAGEVMLYGVVRESKEKGAKYVGLVSSVDAFGFYSHIGFKQNGDCSIYKMKQKDYDRFISQIEKKYDFLNPGGDK